MVFLPPLTTAGIGSVPFSTAAEALDLMAQTCPDLPYWPQLSRVRFREDMVFQAVDGLPLLRIDEDGRRVVVTDGPREEALTGFYERFLAGDLESFAVPREAGEGFGQMLERARQDPAFGPRFLKAQLIGPVSFGSSIRTPDGKNLIDDPELGDTVVKGLAAKAAWLAGKIRETGRIPVVFIDEPGLTGFGSAFSTLSRERVIGMLGEMAEFIRSQGEVILGSHVCGNTDWDMMTRTGLDILHFDAYDYLDPFLLYPESIRRFLEQGGTVAWGVVPTLKYNGRQRADELAQRLRDGWKALEDKGVDKALIRARSLVSSACGLGAVSEEYARAIMRLIPEVAARMADEDLIF
jgi:hypothetical protein